MKKESINQSKNFCMLPWTHMHLWPNGNTYPCCIWDSDQPVGRFSDSSSLMDLWNSEKMKSLRLNMLNDKPTDGCKRCYELEKYGSTETLRLTSNRNYDKHWEFVETTAKDGSLDELRMNYLDIRFNNLCNLRCQTCGPELSSSWYDDQKAMYSGYEGKKIIQISPNEKLWKELEPLLLDVESAYFAGGEPLICDEHYRILDLWLENKKLDIPINYTTNFALLNHKKAQVLEYWKKFNNVSVSASLDDSGPRAEYLRKGTNWSVIEKNREKMLKECPNIHFEITPTISAYNVFHFPEFHYDWIVRGFIKPNDIRLNILTHQQFMNVRIYPQLAKDIISDKYRKYLEMIKDYATKNGQPYNNTESGYNSVIDFMNAQDDTHLQDEFYARARMVDKVRSEEMLKIYPELKLLKY